MNGARSNFHKIPRCVAISFAAITILLCTSCRFPQPNYNRRFSRSDIVTQTDPQDQVAISPDGRLVAHFGTGIWPTRHFDGKTLQFFSVSPTREVASIRVSADLDHGPELGSSDRLQFCDQGKFLIAFEDSDNVNVVDTNNFHMQTTISLKVVKEAFRAKALKKPKGSLYGAGQLIYARCAANAPLAVFYIGIPSLELGDIKLFDLQTGSEIAGFDNLSSPILLAGIAISPSGSSVALVNEVVLPGAQPIQTARDTVTVINVANHSISRRFYVESGAPLQREPIAYAGDHSIVLQLNEFRPYVPSAGGVVGTDEESSIHLFDISTGAEIRTITEPSANSFTLRGVSADGRIILTSAERWRHCIFCKQLSAEVVVTDARFILWDSTNGQAIAEYSNLHLVHHSCPWLAIGSCTPWDEAPEIALNQIGNAVIASWVAGGDQPLSVFTMRTN